MPTTWNVISKYVWIDIWSNDKKDVERWTKKFGVSRMDHEKTESFKAPNCFNFAHIFRGTFGGGEWGVLQSGFKTCVPQVNMPNLLCSSKSVYILKQFDFWQSCHFLNILTNLTYLSNTLKISIYNFTNIAH